MLCLSEERTAHKQSPHISGCKYRASLEFMKFSCLKHKGNIILQLSGESKEAQDMACTWKCQLRRREKIYGQVRVQITIKRPRFREHSKEQLRAGCNYCQGQGRLCGGSISVSSRVFLLSSRPACLTTLWTSPLFRPNSRFLPGPLSPPWAPLPLLFTPVQTPHHPCLACITLSSSGPSHLPLTILPSACGPSGLAPASSPFGCLSAYQRGLFCSFC